MTDDTSPQPQGRSAEDHTGTAKRMAKMLVHGLAAVVVLPLAVLAGFGRLEAGYLFGAQYVALAPGLPGDYLRAAYYGMTLDQCPREVRISFGSFIAQRRCRLGRGVYIGAFCVLGACDIGERTHVASLAQVMSGRHQHGRASDGTIQGANPGQFPQIRIGKDCWIGASALVMADVGERSTVGAGAVVVRSIPADTVAVGNPARPLVRGTERGLQAAGEQA